MGMEIFEIFFSQERRFESTCVSIKWLGWLLLGKPKGRKVAECDQPRPFAAFVEDVAVSAHIAFISPNTFSSQSILFPVLKRGAVHPATSCQLLAPSPGGLQGVSIMACPC
jgi:hypothetical protein